MKSVVAAGFALLTAGTAAAGYPIDAAVQNAQLGRGVSVLAFDPGWSDPAAARFKVEHFARIRAAGFATVKIVMTPQSVLDAQGKPDARWLAYLDSMVDAALAAKLNVILDNFGFDLCSTDIDACARLLDGFWSHLAPHFRDAPNSLLFALLSEPHGAMTPQAWNRQLARTLAVIRTSNPTRNVIVGSAEENSPALLPALSLPEEDRHLIADFHYWAPMDFTHQGATWVGERYKTLHGVDWGSAADLRQVEEDFDAVKAWSEAAQRPVMLESFGAYEPAGMEARVRWTTAVARAAEARGLPWVFWQFGSDFTVYDFKKGEWVAPILRALVPEEPAPPAK